uniref:Putative microvillar protein with insect allergen related repeat n=1 Tax=Nyssomyia neivai TaxID=330878 RepID=A0A1L8DR13_9DIPT
MKLIVLLVLLPLVLCEENFESAALPKANTKGLQEDLQEFADLIPQKEIIGVVLTYIVTDKEVQNIFNYVQTQEFKNLYGAAIRTDAVRELVELLESYGLQVRQAVNQISSLLMLPPLPGRIGLSKASPGGVNGLVDAVLCLLPREELIELYLRKLIESPEIRQLKDNLSSQQTINAAIKVVTNPDVRRAYAELHKRGINLAEIAKQVVVYFLDLN